MRIMPPKSKFFPCKIIFTTCIKNTENIPGTLPNTAPKEGAIKSNRVNLVFEPSTLENGICNEIKPTKVKIKIETSVLFFIVLILTNLLLLSTVN